MFFGKFFKKKVFWKILKIILGVPGSGKLNYPTSLRPLTPQTVLELEIDGDTEAITKFRKVLATLLGKPGPQNKPALVKAILEFLLDNYVVDMKTAAQLSIRYGKKL